MTANTILGMSEVHDAIAVAGNWMLAFAMNEALQEAKPQLPVNWQAIDGYWKFLLQPDQTIAIPKCY